MNKKCTVVFLNIHYYDFFYSLSVDINSIVKKNQSPYSNCAQPRLSCYISSRTANHIQYTSLRCFFRPNSRFHAFNIECTKGIRKALMALEIVVLDIVPAKVDPKTASLL